MNIRWLRIYIFHETAVGQTFEKCTDGRLWRQLMLGAKILNRHIASDISMREYGHSLHCIRIAELLGMGIYQSQRVDTEPYCFL